MIKEGTKILCPKCFRHLFTTARDIFANDKICADMFIAGEQEVPAYGEEMKCHTCKEDSWWFHYGALHTEFGWSRG